jgi:hypothetical protein
VLVEDSLDGGLSLVRLDQIAMLLLNLIDDVLVPVRLDQVRTAWLQNITDEHDRLNTDEIRRHDEQRLLVGRLVV